ncbi:MAG: efflux RND transporter periplasmic adaptor subunit [Treponema sp.]|jgi:HlyD family secretion protein|nr:efflux RND transporter periplasmic adaptor subunit [Treponema sp.]
MRLYFLLIIPLIFSSCRREGRGPVYEFTRIERGNIEKTVASTGSLNPVSTVKVLPRMSGRVESVNVDYNDRVKKGQILAVLNTDMLVLQREQQLAQVIKSRANYELSKINYRNQEALAAKNLISNYELQSTKTTLDIQAAELSAAESNLKAIETEINQYAFITSPIDGIVLERKINVGDTVVDSSSSNSSNIFTLCENLEELQIESWVGELDIASISSGQEVRFTLESLPGRSFSGFVASKHLMPSVQDNVVSYQVIIDVENRDLSLLPGMSCAVEFIEEQRENILLVPNAALRYRPSSLAQDSKNTGANTANRNAAPGLANLMQGNTGRMPGMGRTRAGGTEVQGRENSPPAAGFPKQLWYLDRSGKPAAMLARTGISDGTSTEILEILPSGEEGREVSEGREIILRERPQ